jgi:hypothetical protein
LTANIIPTTQIITEHIQQLGDNSQGVFCAVRASSVRDRKANSIDYLQFSTPHHVCDEQTKTMAADSYEDSGFIIYPPSFPCLHIIHIFPPSFT